MRVTPLHVLIVVGAVLIAVPLAAATLVSLMLSLVIGVPIAG